MKFTTMDDEVVGINNEESVIHIVTCSDCDLSNFRNRFKLEIDFQFFKISLNFSIIIFPFLI